MSPTAAALFQRQRLYSSIAITHCPASEQPNSAMTTRQIVGAILTEHFPRATDDRDEVPNQLVTK
jgi:uncharacterized membrane protein